MVRFLNSTERRIQRNRARLKKAAGDRLRLSVFRSSKHISAQLIDDAKGQTLAAASTLEESFKKDGTKKDAAAAVGKLIAERAKAKGVTHVIFDRGGYLFHGRVKALADAAREGGLEF
ncbi:MAG TPA: 50S ribosomal protein L18 [Caulobacterales bacterium]|nr:50S ribosomal protein L18 [Caulobacterales bacterium]